MRSVEPVLPGASEDERAEDSARLASITRYDVVGRPPSEALQGLARLAASVTGMPLSAIDLVTDHEQYQLATVGFTADVCAREDSLCDVVLQEPGAVVVEDMALDPRFAGNPFVDGTRAAIRFYASQQLVTARGVVIGRLCVFDTEPREIDQVRLDDLRTVADSVVDVLELSLRNRELDGSNARLGGFASRVSHDLKTPLTSISMTLQLLRDEMDVEERSGADAEEVRWLLDKSVAASERLAHMVDSVLSHATIDGQLQRTNVDLQRLVDEVLDDLRVELTDATVEVQPLPTVLGDPAHLRTLVQNLVENAARYRHPDRPLRICVQAEQRGLMQHVTVSDNGTGIAVERQHRIFQHGVRGVPEGSGLAGAGIGLEICRRVVEAHAGTIGVLSDGEHGTTVWFELPV
ncbi:GAF domain-containing sensor histidine kinase [Nocardioides nanhaiensis]|uniref:sensor histidine kinase n=1 Tax=Nocardioides nanhaiensis TaxID=1476871 RepID=UPI0031F07D79